MDPRPRQTSLLRETGTAGNQLRIRWYALTCAGPSVPDDGDPFSVDLSFLSQVLSRWTEFFCQFYTYIKRNPPPLLRTLLNIRRTNPAPSLRKSSTQSPDATMNSPPTYSGRHFFWLRDKFGFALAHHDFFSDELIDEMKRHYHDVLGVAADLIKELDDVRASGSLTACTSSSLSSVSSITCRRTCASTASGLLFLWLRHLSRRCQTCSAL